MFWEKKESVEVIFYAVSWSVVIEKWKPDI